MRMKLSRASPRLEQSWSGAKPRKDAVEGRFNFNTAGDRHQAVGTC